MRRLAVSSSGGAYSPFKFKTQVDSGVKIVI